jgi:FkbM family methyltransferase
VANIALPRWLQAVRHLNRVGELIQCGRIATNPFNLSARYLQIGTLGYPCKFSLKNRLSMQMNNYHDLVTAWIIFCRHEYALDRSAETILDIGANFGAFSLWASFHAPNSRIVAIEPFPDSFARLQQNIKSNFLDNRIATLNLALGEYSQERFLNPKFESAELCPTQSRMFVGEVTPSGPAATQIRILSLTDLVEMSCSILGCERIDFVKMDIEGAEHMAITNETMSALSRIQRLGMEYHPNGSKAKLFRLLERAGLDCKQDRPTSANSGVADFITRK